jgi:hypothetical protein
MPDYSKGQIYTIRCRTDDTKIYVGSTIQPLYKRFYHHKKDSEKEKCMNIKLYIEVNGNWDDWYIELYENYPCNNNNELHKREGEIIRQIGTLNRYISGRDNKQYNIDNADKIKQYYIENADKIKEKTKQYYIENADKIKEKTKQYYIDNADKIKQYYIENTDKIKERKKQYYIENTDKIKERKKQYYIENADKINERKKQYRLKQKEESN